MDFYFWSLSHYKYDWKFKKKKRKEWAEEYQGRPSHFYTQPSRSPFCSVQALAARETMSWRWRTDLPYGVLRTEHMVPDPKHQPPHLWGSTTPIYLSRYGVLGTLCTPYSLHCMYLQQLRTEKVVICPRCPYLPRYANLFVHSACIKQGPDGGCPHSI